MRFDRHYSVDPLTELTFDHHVVVKRDPLHPRHLCDVIGQVARHLSANRQPVGDSQPEANRRVLGPIDGQRDSHRVVVPVVPAVPETFLVLFAVQPNQRH